MTCYLQAARSLWTRLWFNTQTLAQSAAHLMVLKVWLATLIKPLWLTYFFGTRDLLGSSIDLSMMTSRRAMAINFSAKESFHAIESDMDVISPLGDLIWYFSNIREKYYPHYVLPWQVPIFVFANVQHNATMRGMSIHNCATSWNWTLSNLQFAAARNLWLNRPTVDYDEWMMDWSWTAWITLAYVSLSIIIIIIIHQIAH